MSEFVGRKLTVTWDSIAIAAREKSITINGEPVDVSDDSSAGWRELLDEAGEMTVDLSIEGITKSSALRDKVGDQGTMTATYPTGMGSVTGTFQLVSYEEGAPYKEATTFTASFQSSGAVTFTTPD